MVGDVITEEAKSGTAPPKLPNYRIIEKLGEGGMASVWLALREGSTELSVIKVLHEHLASDPVVRSRFLREAQVAAFLDHPNVARLYDAGVSDDASYLAMEFILGQDVEAVMMKLWNQARMPPPALSIAVTLQMLEGLHYAHEFVGADGKHLEIVHRDLSPRNVMITFDGEVKIIDFGLVRTNLGDFRTAPGMIAGTLRYMSPEQATAEALDRRSDIYTWAVVLYELLTGQPVVRGTDARAILGAVVVDAPPPLSQRNPDLPPGLDAVLAKALHKDRDNRFRTAAEFRDAIALAAGDLGVVPKADIAEFLSSLFPEERARATRRTEMTIELPVGPAMEHTRAGAPPPVEPDPAFEATLAAAMPTPPPRPRRSLFWPLSLGVLAVLLVGVVLFTRDHPATPVETSVQPPRPPAVVTQTPKLVPRPSPPSSPPPTEAPPPPKAPKERVRRPASKAKPPPPPASAPSPPIAPAAPFDVVAEVDAFVAEARARLGEAGAEALINECHAGLLVARGPSVNADDAKKKLAECRRMMKKMAADRP